MGFKKVMGGELVLALSWGGAGVGGRFLHNSIGKPLFHPYWENQKMYNNKSTKKQQQLHPLRHTSMFQVLERASGIR